MKYLSIDRIEEGYAVCVGGEGERVLFPKESLPDGAGEGCVVLLADDGTLSLDPEETRRRRERILEKQNRLFGEK